MLSAPPRSLKSIEVFFINFYKWFPFSFLWAPPGAVKKRKNEIPGIPDSVSSDKRRANADANIHASVRDARLSTRSAFVCCESREGGCARVTICGPKCTSAQYYRNRGWLVW